jgi:hypothetical protein
MPHGLIFDNRDYVIAGLMDYYYYDYLMMSFVPMTAGTYYLSYKYQFSSNWYGMPSVLLYDSATDTLYTGSRLDNND